VNQNLTLPTKDGSYIASWIGRDYFALWENANYIQVTDPKGAPIITISRKRNADGTDVKPQE